MKEDFSRHNKNASVERMLGKYTACTAVGLAAGVAAFESADAALVTTTHGLTATLASNQTIDIDGDGDNDLTFVVAGTSILQVYPLGNGTAGSLQNVGLMGTRVGPKFYPSGLVASNNVGGSQTFDFVPSNGSASSNFGTMAFNSVGVPNAAWDPAPSDAYLGVVLNNGGSTPHYGYVHVTWDGANAVIVDSGYETTAGTAAHVPEPSGLALLALGAAGLMQRRKRKQD